MYTGVTDSPTRIFSGSAINQEQEVTWIPYVLTSDLGYVDCKVSTSVNSTETIPNSPNSNMYIPVVIRHSETDNAHENIAYNSYFNGWTIYSDHSQTTGIRFYKYPV